MSSDNLKILENYCIGTAESELSFLKEVFVDSGRYADIIDTPERSPRLLLGRKGSGKSAFLKYLETKALEANIEVLYLKPDDLLDKGSGLNQSGEDIASLKRYYSAALVNTIAVKLGEKLRGLIVNRKDKKLFDRAIQQGVKDPDFVQVAIGALASFGSFVTQKDFSKLIPGRENLEPEALREVVKEKIGGTANKIFFLLIDDIDQVSAPRSQINRIWAFLLACKKFCEDIPGVRCFISIRTEVWKQLCNDKHGQRDQVDHLERLLHTLDPSDEEISLIINRRLQYVARVLKINDYSDPYDVFFQSHTLNLPSAEDAERTWKSFFIKQSRNRPRDAIQYLAILAKLSREKKFGKIPSSIIDDAARIYSAERFEQLAREFSQDCAECDQIVKEFSNYKFILKAEEIKIFLSKLPSSFGITIRGRTLHPSDNEDVFILWHFLHEMGFLNPRVPDPKAPKGYVHIRFEEDPRFVMKTNWNEMQTVEWEIHPAYRSHLLALKDRRKFFRL